MRDLIWITLFFLIGFSPISFGSDQDDSANKQKLFEKVFDGAVQLDSQMVQKVLQGKKDERHYADADGDGQPEEVWFIDNDSRHPERYRPLLVRAIDEDGDLLTSHEPDIDSDLYVADWKADGSVDAVLDYNDKDGDGDADEMAMYFYGGSSGYFNEPVLRVWWGRDVGDDNLLWHDIGYTYDQTLCQYRTHFGGDEMFAAFALPLSGQEWIPFFENPFLFYDRDGDGVTEEVLRLSGVDDNVESIRWSFDADNDAARDQPRDFDVSITAWAPGVSWINQGRQRGQTDLRFDERFAERHTLRGIPTAPFLRYESAPAFARPIVWERAMLTWDEDDRNVDEQQYADANERWEGVIANGNEDFPQVGGPSCGAFNKRYELAMKPNGPLRYYYHPADGRLHLRGADKSWIDVDMNFDRRTDMRYEMIDEDGDGVIDQWSIDVNADGTPEDVWRSDPSLIQEVDWNRADVNAATSFARRRNQWREPLVHYLIKLLQTTNEEAAGTMLSLLNQWGRIESFSQDEIDKFIASPETQSYRYGVKADRLIAELKKYYKNEDFWQRFDRARSQGDLEAMLQCVMEKTGVDDYAKPEQTKISTGAVAWAQDWVPPNIGWESEKIAYRVYWGQFDFFGKKNDCLIYPTIGAMSYHDETEWGIDALLVGESAGCGGATLYINGKAWPVRNPAGKGEIVFTKRLLSQDETHITIEHLAEGAGPKDNPYTIRFHCFANAGRKDSPIDITIEGGKEGDEIALGIGLTKMPQEALLFDSSAGVMGVWGAQTPVIGTIGMGIVFPKNRFLRIQTTPDENQAVLQAERGKTLRYHIQCDWLRGRRFDRCPSAGDWLNELRALAAEVKLR
ncbi:MAG: DUF4861 family protein [Candidatus Omnitrophota bacterium]